jgi:hypothetical protein
MVVEWAKEVPILQRLAAAAAVVVVAAVAVASKLLAAFRLHGNVPLRAQELGHDQRV